jgi:cysteine desulfurase NifS
MINSEDADQRDIVHGEKVSIVTARGRIEMYALVTDDIVKGTVEVSGMGGGALGPAEWRDACVNDLTDLNNYDPISGFPAYKSLLCDVQKTRESEIRSVSFTGEYKTTAMVDAVQTGRTIYLDNNATTSLHPLVRDKMFDFASYYGNPSSIHGPGREVHRAVEESRKALSLLLNCTPRRITFNGGGSEGNNFIIKGVALAQDSTGHQIITSAIEHPSVLNTCRWLEARGFAVTYLTPDSQGLIDPAHLSAALSQKTCLVSIMAANNETGSLQQIAEFARIAHKKGALFHTDAVQAVGKIPVDVERWGVDFLTLSGHKFHGPKGTGAVYIRKGIEVEPLIHGGKQEWGLRGGTENVLGIIGIGHAAEIAGRNMDEVGIHIAAMRDALQNGIASLIPEARFNGHPTERLPNTLNVTLPGVRGESLVLALDTKGVFFSSASACKSGSPEPSHVLLAMGLSEEEAHCTVRFSLGTENTEEDISETLRLLKEVLETSVSTVRFASCR